MSWKVVGTPGLVQRNPHAGGARDVFGVGLAKYFGGNVYISGTLATARLSVQEDNQEVGRSSFGLGASVMVGKEWWVSQKWGLGVAGQAFFGRMKDSDSSSAPTWGTGAIAVAFSATYN